MSVDLAYFSTDRSTDRLNEAEQAFLAGVFTYHHIQGPPTAEEFRDGLVVMSAYAMQCQDNPPEDAPSAGYSVGIHGLSDTDRLMTAAVIFLRFGVTKPSTQQWLAASQALFGQAPTLELVNSAFGARRVPPRSQKNDCEIS